MPLEYNYGWKRVSGTRLNLELAHPGASDMRPGEPMF